MPPAKSFAMPDLVPIKRALLSVSDKTDLIAFARERLAGFKTPKQVVFMELPKTSTGKIQKFELRAAAKSL